jgi:hypothetical protein
MRAHALLASALFVVVAGCKMTNGENSRIESDVECESCTIVLDSVATLRGIDFQGPATAIERDATGAFYIRGASDGLLRLYDQDGRIIRQIGLSGGGPGEYEMVRNILPAPDSSVHVLDGALARHSVFANDGKFLGSVPAQVSGGMGLPAVLLEDGRIVVNTRATARGGRTDPVQVLASDGTVIGLSEEEDGTPPQSPSRWLQERLLWGRRGGGVIVGQPYSFSFSVYSGDLRRRSTFRRLADWIPSVPLNDSPSDGVFDQPFTPRVRGVWESEPGQIWLHIMVPSSSWTPGPPQREGAGMTSEAFLRLAGRPRVETILEVVSVEHMRVIARSRIPGSIGIPFGGGYFAMTVQDSVGEPSVRVSRAYLRH